MEKTKERTEKEDKNKCKKYQKMLSITVKITEIKYCDNAYEEITKLRDKQKQYNKYVRKKVKQKQRRKKRKRERGKQTKFNTHT